LSNVAVLLQPYDAVYIEIPKVACSSIKIALAGLLGIDLGPANGNPHEVAFPTLSATPSGAELYPGLFSFGFVRNPWDRLVSCYRDKILGEVPDFTAFHPTRGIAHCLARFEAFRPAMTFRDFVRVVADISDDDADDHFRAQRTFVSNAAGDIAVNFIGRFENLASDFSRVAETLGLPGLELTRAQALRAKRRYAEFYSAETRSIVATRFREDIHLFGYDFNGA
jgi:hypothetical protein